MFFGGGGREVGGEGHAGLIRCFFFSIEDAVAPSVAVRALYVGQVCAGKGTAALAFRVGGIAVWTLLV